MALDSRLGALDFDELTDLLKANKRSGLLRQLKGLAQFQSPAGFAALGAITHTAGFGQGQNRPNGSHSTIGNRPPSFTRDGPGVPGGGNHDPVANPDFLTLNEDGQATINVLANDTDSDGDILTLVSFTEPTFGNVDDLGNGNFRYRPWTDYYGTDAFSYVISDGHGGSAYGSVNINIQPVNDPWLARDDEFWPKTNLPYAYPGLWANDYQPDTEFPQVEVVQPPTYGTINVHTDGWFDYTPSGSTPPVDSFTYRVSDGTVWGNVASVTLHFGELPLRTYVDIPRTDEGVSVDFSPQVNDQFVVTLPNERLHVVEVTEPGFGTAVVLPSNGSYPNEAVVRYTPNAGFAGDDYFQYKVEDEHGNSDWGHIIVTVDPLPGDPPIAVDNLYETSIDTPLVVSAPGILGNDWDPNGDPITAVLEQQPRQGTVTLQSNGAFHYTPNPGFQGTDFFIYQASDGTSHSWPAMVAIGVGVQPEGEKYEKIINGPDGMELGQLIVRIVEGEVLAFWLSLRGAPGKGLSLRATADALFRHHFNWYQVITDTNRQNLTDAAGNALQVPFVDPPVGGYGYNWADDLPWYGQEVSIPANLAPAVLAKTYPHWTKKQDENGKFSMFADVPSGPNGSITKHRTQLVAVLDNGSTPMFVYGFSWRHEVKNNQNIIDSFKWEDPLSGQLKGELYDKVIRRMNFRASIDKKESP